MAKLSELNIPTREGNLRNPERLSQSLKDIGQKAEPWKRLATEGFGRCRQAGQIQELETW